MITIKNNQEIEWMRQANAVVRDVLTMLEEHVKPGVTTKQLDKIAHDYILSQKAIPSFLGYGGFPATICASVNQQVIHGIPNNKVLQEGDIVSVDVGAILNGYQGDAARTFGVGKISVENARLIEVTKDSFFEAVKVIKAGARLGDIGYAVQAFVETNNMTVVKKYVGHGIGKEMHEDPAVPNFGKMGHGLRLRAGMTLAIEPMVNLGSDDVKTLDDNWTVVTVDGKNSAHYENTVLITQDGCEILSL